MSRRLVLLNVLLVVISAASVMYIARELASKASTSGPRARGVAASTPAAVPTTAAGTETPAAAPGYALVASRNLFSPTRSEAPPSAMAGALASPPVPKPNLYGVVVREGSSIAYLEDPTTKRVAGYRPGDSVPGGTVQLIAADHVVLNRPEGSVEVRLSDPAKPRPPAPPAAAPGAIVPGAVPPVIQPGVPRPPEGAVTPPGQAVVPPAVGESTPPITGRRPLPPNLRRARPGTVPDAPPQ